MGSAQDQATVGLVLANCLSLHLAGEWFDPRHTARRRGTDKPISSQNLKSSKAVPES